MSSSSSPSEAKLAAVKAKVEDTRLVMVSNIREASSRGNKLDELDMKAIELEADSDRFNIDAHRVRRRLCVRAWKWYACIALGVIILLIIIIAPTAASLSKK